MVSSEISLSKQHTNKVHNKNIIKQKVFYKKSFSNYVYTLKKSITKSMNKNKTIYYFNWKQHKMLWTIYVNS